MLEAGQKAPDFELDDQNGNNHSLKNYAGKWIVLYFYPKDMTPGCTTEACSFRNKYSAFGELNTVVLGVSKDSVARHKKFADKYELPFPLLSDEQGELCDAFGVWKEKSLYGRTFMGIVRSTFLIDPQGVIAKVYPKVKVKEHTAEVLAEVRSRQ